MNEEKFLEDFINQFDEIPEGVNMDTQFKDIEGWDSLTALCVMSMIENIYSVNLLAKDFQENHTINDLFKLVENKNE